MARRPVKARAVNHADGRQLALALQKRPAHSGQPGGHARDDLVLRRDRVTEIALHAGPDRALDHRVVAAHQYLAHRAASPLRETPAATCGGGTAPALAIGRCRRPAHRPGPPGIRPPRRVCCRALEVRRGFPGRVSRPEVCRSATSRPPIGRLQWPCRGTSSHRACRRYTRPPPASASDTPRSDSACRTALCSPSDRPRCKARKPCTFRR